MPFSSIEGQDRAINYLKRSLGQARLGHALLFTGPEGVGKKATALALAQVLNCQDQQGQDACGVCSACKKIMDHHHPDIQVVAPEGQYIKIDQIREQVQHQVLLNPMEGRVKVYIIDAADSMTVEAANSLLKILEEPPSFVVLVLIATQPFLLLDTIRSRCQEVRFHPLPISLMATWVQQHLGLGKLEALALARLSGGRPAEAQRLAGTEAQSLRRLVIEQLRETFNSGRWAQATQALMETRSELPEALGMMLSWFRDVLLLSAGGPQELVVNVDYLDELNHWAQAAPQTRWAQDCQLILTAINQLKRNINLQLMLDVLLMRLGYKNRPGQTSTA